MNNVSPDTALPFLQLTLKVRPFTAIFWKFTLVTVTLGWWGTFSMFITPFFLLNNLLRYLFCVGMPSAGGARRPVLTAEAVRRIRPFTKEIINRRNRSEPVQSLVHDVSARAGVTLGQVVMYIHRLAVAAQRTRFLSRT